MKKNEPKLSPLDRRGFLEGLAAGAGGVALSGCGGGGDEPLPPLFEQPLPPSTIAQRMALPRLPLPNPAASGIDRIVLVTMENRSYDHFLGWVPNSEGLQSGLRFSDAFGEIHPTFPLAPHPDYGFESCGWADPDHSYEGGRTHLNGGKRNGWLLSPDTNKKRGDKLPIGYYRAEDLEFYRAAVAQYSVCDYYFSGVLSQTYPNRIYLHSGQTDRLGNSLITSTLPTIWDRLAEKSISRGYYYHDAPFTALYGTRYTDISKKIESFYSEAAAGTLPAFSMVDPRFGGAASGSSNDDHPLSDVRNGQAFLSQVYEALRSSPTWGSTLMIVVYDEWGGFYDHVEPPLRPVSSDERALGNDGRLGFRVPCLLLGPRVPRAQVSRYAFDPSSIHQLLDWRFGLDFGTRPLGVRSNDPSTFNLALALDFINPPRADRVQLPTLAERVAECPSALPLQRTPGDDRRSAQGADPQSESGLPGGHFHEVWLKARANGFPL